MKLLSKEQQESYEYAKIYYIFKEKFGNKYLKDKKYCKVRNRYHYTGEYRGIIYQYQYYQILLLIYLKDFIELNVNQNMLIKNVKRGIKYKQYCNCFLEYANFKDDLIEYYCLSCKKSY